MQFKVPQNVQIEDKVLPFMTMRQLIICFIGGGLAYIVYIGMELQPMEIWLPPVAILVGLTLSIAFVEINGVPFVSFILLVLEQFLNERKRWWIKSAGDIYLTDTPQIKKVIAKQEARKRLTPEMLERLSCNLDAQDPLQLKRCEKAHTSF